MSFVAGAANGDRGPLASEKWSAPGDAGTADPPFGWRVQGETELPNVGDGSGIRCPFMWCPREESKLWFG